MTTARLFACLISAGSMVVGAGMASGQAFPNKPIRMVGSEVGSFLDVLARAIAQGISPSLGQPVIIENRPTIPTGEFLAGAQPDGYTLTFGGGSTWLNTLTEKTSYDPLRDFAPVSLMATNPYILAIHPSVPAKTIKEFIDLAKAKPGVLNAGASPDPGSASWLGVELFKAMAGVDIVRVPYRGAGPGTTALLANEVQMYFISPPTVVPHIKSGKLRALAVTSLEPTSLAPGMPTVAASGLPGFELLLISGILAPGKTPSANINKLNQEIARFLSRADVKEKFLAEGAELAPSSSAQFAAKIKSEMTKWRKVLKDACVKVIE